MGVSDAVETWEVLLVDREGWILEMEWSIIISEGKHGDLKGCIVETEVIFGCIFRILVCLLGMLEVFIILFNHSLVKSFLF